jgi:hypothetical protein
MPNTTFSDADRKQLDERGMAVSEAERQLELLRTPPPALDLVRPCTPGDGIVRLSPQEIERLRTAHDRAARAGRFLKFVPASGAASRMFKDLRRYLDDRRWDGPWDSVVALADGGDADARNLVRMIARLPDTALFEELETAAARRGADARALVRAGEFRTLFDLMLGADPGFADRPKGLLPFHADPEGGRTAFDEHLVEAASYARDASGTGRLHFTVGAGREPQFRARLDEVAERIGGRFEARFDVGFSVQDPSTDTLAAEEDGAPLRDADGRLVFRPGGHGALLSNLDRFGTDLVYVKNIDNVQPDARRGETVAWKRALGGLLVELQDEILRHLDQLVSPDGRDEAAEGARRFAERWFRLEHPATSEGAGPDRRRERLLRWLERPIRVCGVVANTGEPGGGPFWVRDREGRVSRQIVEAAQVAGDRERMDLLRRSTHFNPVDLVCAVADRTGRPYDLAKFVDRDTAIVTEKSFNGREVRVLERPGLWNGAMAGWNTVFVEVPLETFSPVKTVFDLVRPEHLPPR